MTNPIITVELLEHLVKLGFNDEYFDIVHHFNGETIDSHKNYCVKHSGLFMTGGTNEQVQQRLRIVLNSYVFGSFTCTEVFRFLAHASVTEVPYKDDENT